VQWRRKRRRLHLIVLPDLILPIPHGTLIIVSNTCNVKACPHWRLSISATICRRKQRLSQKTATVAEFGDCRRCLAVFCDSRRFRRQSHFSATVWTGLYTTCTCIVIQTRKAFPRCSCTPVSVILFNAHFTMRTMYIRIRDFKLPLRTRNFIRTKRIPHSCTKACIVVNVCASLYLYCEMCFTSESGT